MKEIVIYPILFAINPVLLVFSANVSDLPLVILFPGILIIPLFCTGLLAWLKKLTNNIHRAGFLVFLMEIWFFHYGTVHLMVTPFISRLVDLNPHWLLIPAWCFIFIGLGSNLVWNKITSPQTITSFFNLLAISLVVFSSARIIVDVIPRYTPRPISAEVSQSINQPVPRRTMPDVYLIILDGYARLDVLADLFQYDNQAFVQELEKRGFQVPTDSKSNYMQTALSLASMLNLDYLNDIAANAPDRGQLIGMISHSQARAVLNGFGYQMSAVSSGYQPTEMVDAENYYSADINRGWDFEALLAVNSMVKPFFESGWLRLPIMKYEIQQERISYAYNILATLPATSNPQFVFAHLLTPHPPFIFDEHGPITPEHYYILADGERFGNNRDAYRSGYIAQVEYTNHMILQTIDAIFGNSEKPPIIIIIADHGSGMFLNTGSADTTCHYERFSIFSAFHLPGVADPEIPADISAVNVFRVLFNTYYGADFDLLKNSQYYSSWGQPYQFTDVTALSDLPCALP